jgi:hypothetical protein
MPSPNNRHGNIVHHDRSSPVLTARASHHASSGNEEDMVDEEPEIKSRKKSSRSSGPKLNTWDVPEFLPGAMPSATAVQKAFFEERSKKVFSNNLIMDQIEAEAALERRNAEQAEKFEAGMQNLVELFPSVDVETIQESFLLFDGDLDATINQLLVISLDTRTDTNPKGEKKGPPSSDDEKEFPTLPETNGWEVVDMKMTIQESPYTGFKDRLLGNKHSSQTP